MRGQPIQTFVERGSHHLVVPRSQHRCFLPLVLATRETTSSLMLIGIYSN